MVDVHLTLANSKGGMAAHFPYSENAVNRIKTILGFNWNPEQKAWVSAGPEVLLDMERFNYTASFDNGALFMAQRFREKLWSILELKGSEEAYQEEEFGYQKVGSDILTRFECGILADDMGMGKSKQALDAFMKMDELTMLVLAPNTLVWNWYDEAKKWHPDLKVLMLPSEKSYLGGRDSKNWRPNRFDFWKEFPENEKVLIIANYEKIRLSDWPMNRKWGILALDEAQRLKNWQSQLHKKAKIIASHSNNVWAITGTPLEIHLHELFNIFAIVRPSVLGDGGSGWIRFSQQHCETDFDGSITGARQLELLRERIAPWVIRRTKEQVLHQLPGKLPPVEISVEMSKWEAEQYEKMKKEFKLWTRENTGGSFSEMTQTLRFRQFLCSPQLVMETEERGCKWEALEQLVEDYNERILIFTDFAQMAKRLREWLGGSREAYIDGDIKPKDRIARVSAFNEGKLGKTFVSTDAGREGINVTGATMIIHYNPLWNPQWMRQREDRLDRLGQTKPVQPVNILVRDSLEYGMRAILKERADLFESVIENADQAMMHRIGLGRLRRAMEGK